MDMEHVKNYLSFVKNYDHGEMVKRLSLIVTKVIQREHNFKQ